MANTTYPRPTKKAPTRNHEEPTERPEQLTGSIGPQGPAGPAGPPGAPGHDHASEITMMRAQIDQLVKELQTQLTRIGQLQAQLDHVESGRASEPQKRRITDRVEH